MRRTVRLLTAVCCLLAATPFYLAHAAGQSVGAGVLSRKITNLNLTDATLMETLGTLSIDYGVPIGFELSTTEKYEPKVNLHFTDATLRDVLKAIAGQEPDYRWEERGGVINFTPVKSPDAFLGKLLNTRVRRFTVGKGHTKFEIRDAITELPEVRSLLEANKMQALNFYYASGSKPISFKEGELDVSDTDVRGVLNAVVTNGRSKMWVVQRLGENREVLQIGL
jgi:hypothetical protein